MPEASRGGGVAIRSSPRILLLAHRPLTDADFGGGQRTSHIRTAAADIGDVDTLVIMTDVTPHWARGWDAQRTMTLAGRSGKRAGALLDHLRVRRRVREVLESTQYDVVIARYLSAGLTVPRRYRDRLILDADDILKTPSRSESGWRGALAVGRSAVRGALLRSLVGQVGHVWFVNARDLTTLGPLARDASLLPNAAIAYDAQGGSREPDSLMIVGHYAHAPNREAVEFLLDGVLPGLREKRPEVVLRIVGSVPPHCGDTWASVPNVQVLGFVEDLGAEYARTALAVAPVHSGGGTQIKLIEALANGCPTVASPFAYAGFSHTVEADRHLYVAGSTQEWIDTCLKAFDDSARSEAMAEAAANVVRSVYGVDAMQERVRRVLLTFLGDAGTQSIATEPAAIRQSERRSCP